MSHFNKQKAFGQHFLVDGHVIQSIVKATLDALKANPGHSLLEIGPGKGAITRPLLEHLPYEVPFILAERDRDLIDYWNPETRLKKILKGDFLDHSESELDELGPMVVVSNLPYSAGTAIVVKLAEQSARIPEMILMFQAEVAQRLYANASTKDRGSLSLYIQNEWDIEKVIEVKPTSFKPPPKVMSEVVRLRRKARPYIELTSPEDRARWNDLLKTAFKQRRKMIKGNFAGTPWAEKLKQSGVDPTKRAESLEWDEWVKLW